MQLWFKGADKVHWIVLYGENLGMLQKFVIISKLLYKSLA